MVTETRSGPLPPPRADRTQRAVNAAAALCLAALLGYALLAAPRREPWRRDFYTLWILGYDNAVTFVLLNTLGLLPCTLAGLMAPALKSDRLPLDRFLLASLAAGAFAILPYLAAWQAPAHRHRVPPTAQTVASRKSWMLRLTESRWLPAALLACYACLVTLLAAANAATWAAFWGQAARSWLVSVALGDCAALTALASALCLHDAHQRGWPLARSFPFALVPVVGPTAYLALRPIAHRHAPHHPHHAAAEEEAGAAEADGGGVRGWVALLAQPGAAGAAEGYWEGAKAAAARAQGAAAGWFAGRGGAFKHRIKRVLSFVFQGPHIERERHPVRQYSVASDHVVADELEEDAPRGSRDQGGGARSKRRALVATPQDSPPGEVEAEPPAGDELDVADMDFPPG